MMKFQPLSFLLEASFFDQLVKSVVFYDIFSHTLKNYKESHLPNMKHRLSLLIMMSLCQHVLIV